jgi:hypothetical protein
MAKRELGALDRAGDRFALRGDRGGNGLVFGVYKIDDLQRRGEIDLGGARVAALGKAGVDERHVVG